MSEEDARKELSEKLGIEFFSEETPASKFGAISVNEIIKKCYDARKKMSPKNRHGELLFLCSIAINQLATRLATAESVIKSYKQKVH